MQFREHRQYDVGGGLVAKGAVVVAKDQRARVLGVYTMMFGIGSALGTILAGELVQHFGWRAVFWFRAPIALLAFALTWTFPRDTPRGQQRFDAPGAVLLVAAISFLLLLNLVQGGRRVFIGTEPPVDRMAKDVFDMQLHNSHTRAYLPRNMPYGLGPSMGGIYNWPGTYYMKILTGEDWGAEDLLYTH